MRNGRWTAGLLQLLLLTVAPGAGAQGVAATGGSPAVAGVRASATAGGQAYTSTVPVTVRMRANNRWGDVILVGYTASAVVVTDASGRNQLVDRVAVDEAIFALSYDQGELDEALFQRQWKRAAARLDPVVRPLLPYLGLPNNNGAALALEWGDCTLRAAQQDLSLAATPEQRAAALKGFGSAYAIFDRAATATWYSGGTIAGLKCIQCLMAIGREDAAGKRLEMVDESEPGDAAVGLYWLVKAQLSASRKDFAAALDAAVHSVAFENKDVNTFPDALMLSARCYEALGDWYRARDIYAEVATIFTGTEWADAAARRLQGLLNEGRTAKAEDAGVEAAFFGMKEDGNQLAQDVLDRRAKPQATP